MKSWLALMRPGDYLVVALSSALVVLLAQYIWSAEVAQMAVIARDGKVLAKIKLDRPQRQTFPGAIGNTVVEIQVGRARVVEDPSPRQYCVRQGWLKTSGAIALCIPNHISLALVGSTSPYDTLTY